MTMQIIGSILIVLFFLLLNKVRIGLLGENHKLGNIFVAGSIVITVFLVGLIFLG